MGPAPAADLRRPVSGGGSHDLDDQGLVLRVERLVGRRPVGSAEDQRTEHDGHEDAGQGHDEGQPVPADEGVDGRPPGRQQCRGVPRRHRAEDRHRERPGHLLGDVDDAGADARVRAAPGTRAMVSSGVKAVAAPKPISSTAEKIWGK